MNLSLLGRWLALWVMITASAFGAEVSGTSDEAALRGAVTKSLSFLAREGDKWMNDQTCNACHHLPVLLWSLREAKQRGFPVDEKAYQEFVEWSAERAKDPRSGPEMLALLKLALPDQPAADWTKLLTGLQQADGSWKPGGQFASMQKRELNEAKENSTRLILLALAAANGDQVAADAARAKAVASLARDAATPAKSLETLAFRALYADRFGTPAEVAALRTRLLDLQHPDGGWSWWVGEEQSDPLATGQALYALQRAPDPAAEEAVAIAQRWLLSQQRADGSWPIDYSKISRLDRSTPAKASSAKAVTDIYTFWGSAWATIGLLEGLPAE